MKTLHNRLTADLIGATAHPTATWTDCLEQVCPVTIAPSFAMDQTACEGP
jgi:hypothetical protein